MPYTPPVTEQIFVLEHIADLSALARTDRFTSATPEMVAAVLDGVADLAVNLWAPLSRAGDRQGARWSAAGVTMPSGFREAYRAYVDGGWGALAIDANYGGAGLPFVVQTAILETLGSANAAFALCPILTLGAIEALEQHGSLDQRARYLPKLATGIWTGTMNLTEPQAGSDVGAIRTRADPLGDGRWRITGTKIFISYGDHDLADNILHLVLARTPGAPHGTRGISLFLVPKFRLDASDAPKLQNDIRVVSLEHKLGLHASPTCVLSFGEQGDCIGELIGPECGGMRAMFSMMNNARLNVGLQGVQIAEAATQTALTYATNRIQSGRAGSESRAPIAIIDHPDVRRMLIRMRAETQAARALVYYAAGLVDRARLGDMPARDRLDLLIPLVKAHATNIASEVASLGIQVHGGAGYIEDTGAAQFYRDARILGIYEGTNGIQAADLVMRKLPLADGQVLTSLFDEMRAEVEHEKLRRLLEACSAAAEQLDAASVDDRLAASTPLLTMLATAVCGWLIERQCRVSELVPSDFRTMKRSVAAFYLDQIVPEALGLAAAAMAPAISLYSLSVEALTS